MNEIVNYKNKPLTKANIVAQKRLIQEVMEAVMKEGTHYGTIPGCKQPSLYKAGSEAILTTFRIAVDPSVEDLSGVDYFRYRVTLRGIIPSGEVVGSGVGECSTDEEKYKWRGVVCPEEYDATPEDRRRIIWKRADKWHRENYQVQQVRTNPADLANTVLKMAKKRAQIDLTLTATGASDVFAQDLEDLPDEVREELTREDQPQRGKPEVQQPQAKSQQTGPINESQKKLLYVKLKQADISEADFLKFYNIEHVTDLPAATMNEALAAIKEGKIPVTVEEEKTPEKCVECGELNGHAESCPLWEPPNE